MIAGAMMSDAQNEKSRWSPTGSFLVDDEKD